MRFRARAGARPGMTTQALPHQIAANITAFAIRGVSPIVCILRITSGGWHGSHSHRRRQQAQRHDPDLRRQERGAAADDRGLLTEETLILDNVPRLADVAQLQRILGNHGVDIMSAGKRPGDHEYQGQTLHISAANIVDTTAPYELVSKMRASFWVIAPLLARMGEAKVSLPGGCAIGTRPVDLLIMALEKLGAEIEIDGGYVIAKAPGGLSGAAIDFPKVTVGGTHVALMAATLAKGTTVIENAAREPEIVDVADCLNKMGAKITGAGTPRIIIEGVDKLHGARHTVLPDRIETGTYAMAVAMTGGDVQLAGARPELLQSALDVLTAGRRRDHRQQ